MRIIFYLIASLYFLELRPMNVEAERNDELQASEFPENYGCSLMHSVCTLIQDDIKDTKLVWHCGCKNGASTQILKKFIAANNDVFATDTSESLINWAHQYNSCVDFMSFDDDFIMPMIDSFELVISIQYFHWVKNKAQKLQEFYGTLKPGGLLVIVMNYSSEDRDPLSLWQRLLPELANYMPPGVKITRDLVSFYSASPENMHELLLNTGFEDIKISTIIKKYDFTREKDLIDIITPTFLRLPITLSYIPQKDRMHLLHKAVCRTKAMRDFEEKGYTRCAQPFLLLMARKPEKANVRPEPVLGQEI